jgi:hypothetical protein
MGRLHFNCIVGFFVFVLVTLGFEPRALHLLDRCSTVGSRDLR